MPRSISPLPLWKSLPTLKGSDHCGELASWSGSLCFGCSCRCQRPRQSPSLGRKGGGPSLSCMCMLTATEPHTWYPHVAGAAFAISPQGLAVGCVLKNREGAWQDTAHRSSCPFFLWSHGSPCDMNTRVALLLIFVCTMPVALPSRSLACFAWPADTLALYKWVCVRHSHHGTLTLLETEPGFDKSRALDVSMWHAWLPSYAGSMLHFVVFEETAVWLCMVKPYDFFQKLMHNVLCFPFIDALNAYRPEATLRQSLMQYLFFYLNVLHIHSFSPNVSRFVSNKCFWYIDICQLRISSKGLLHFHSFIYWAGINWHEDSVSIDFDQVWISYLKINDSISYIIQNLTNYSELSDNFLLDYVHETGFIIMPVQYTHCSIQQNDF